MANPNFDGQVKFTFEPRYGLRTWMVAGPERRMRTPPSFSLPSAWTVPGLVTAEEMPGVADEFTPTLHSLSWPYEWMPGENVATCLRTNSSCERPRIGCECGFWSYWTEDYWGTGAYYGPQIAGVVEAWDRVIVGPKGMRASRARVVALARPLRVSSFLAAYKDFDRDALEDRVHEGLLRYDVPIFDSVRSMLDAFPLTPPPPPKEAAA